MFKNDNEKLNAFFDNELNEEQKVELLTRLDNEPKLKSELCDMHRVKDLLNFAYPLNQKNKRNILLSNRSFGAIAVSFFLLATLGFVGGYLTSEYLKGEPSVVSAQAENQQNKVILYLGSSKKEKFDETLNKAESLLKKYKKEGVEVYVVTSAGGIDLLRTNNQRVQHRIKNMSGLYKSLHFVACNNQIYHMHKKGQPVNLVEEAEVAPSAVQFVVDHLKEGWKYIAI